VFRWCLQLDVLPLVHGDGTHEGQMDAQAAMLAGALQADPDAIGHGNPLRIVSSALEAFLGIPRKRRGNFKICQRNMCLVASPPSSHPGA